MSGYAVLRVRRRGPGHRHDEAELYVLPWPDHGLQLSEWAITDVVSVWPSKVEAEDALLRRYGAPR